MGMKSEKEIILIAKFMGWRVDRGYAYFQAYKPNAKKHTSIKATHGWPSEESAWNSIADKCKYNSSSCNAYLYFNYLERKIYD